MLGNTVRVPYTGTVREKEVLEYRVDAVKYYDMVMSNQLTAKGASLERQWERHIKRFLRALHIAHAVEHIKRLDVCAKLLGSLNGIFIRHRLIYE